MANDATKVTFGKPKVGGAVFYAPYGTTLPTSAEATLNSSFVCLGYVSEDGVRNTNSPTTEKKKAWGGDVVAVPMTEKSDDWSFTLIEATNVNVLKAVYGSANVSGTLAGGITVRANSTEPEAACWVIDMIMTDGVAERHVLPNAKISELGEISYVDNELVGFDITLAAMPGDATSFGGDTHKTYIKKTSGGGTSGSSS